MKKKNRNKNRKFEAGVSLIVATVLLVSGMSMVSGINPMRTSSSPPVDSGEEVGGSSFSELTPHPIYGYASYCNGGWAVGASVEVVSSEGTLTDTVGSGGEWQVDCGCPVPCWPDGTDFTVWINGTGGYTGWQNVSYDTVSGYYNDMGTLVLYPPELVADASYDEDCHVPDDSVQFYGSASGGATPYSWDWNFDDGGSSTEQNPTHQFDNPGSYNVCLTVTDDCGNTDIDCVTVVINDELSADCGGPYSGTLCDPIQFYGDADGGCEPYDWYWEFDDGGTSTSQNPSHQYTSTGTYTVTLTVTDDQGSSDDDTTTATVTYTPPVANAHGPYYGAPGVPIQFTGSASGGCTPYSYYWTFGDGGTSTQKNPSHTYDEEGTYTVTFKVTDNEGNTDTDTTYAEVSENLTANAHGPYHGRPGETIQFNGSASGGFPPYSWHWEFGDTHSSDEQNSTHAYTNVGNYTVTLTVTDDESNTNDSTTWALIEEIPPGAPDIDGPTSGKAGTSYDYTFTSTDPDGDDVSYYIKWGDGTTSGWTAFQSSGPPGYSESHTWSAQGTYNITAKAKDTYGAESDWATLEVTMPKNKVFNFNFNLLEWLFERFPNAFPILRHLLGL